MTAPGDPGRRLRFLLPVIAAILLLGEILPAPFVAGPLLLLLLLTPPRTGREWGWLTGCALLTAIGLWPAADPVSAATDAALLFYTGMLIVLLLAGVRRLSTRLIGAAVFTAVAVAGWGYATGLTWRALREPALAGIWAELRGYVPTLPASPALDPGATAGPTVAAAIETVVSIVDAMPGMTLLLLIGGGWLATALYHRVATAPIGPALTPFRALGFNDQLIWLLIAGASAWLAAPTEAVRLAGMNTVLVLGALYLARGLAVFPAAFGLLPGFLRFFALFVSVITVTFPFLLVTLGVFDTWFDFRRRLAPPDGASA